VHVLGTYIHNIDPIFLSICGVHLWWYGLCYALGFLGLLGWFRGPRNGLSRPAPHAYDLALWVGGGVLVGARLVEVGLYEWPFYRHHVHLIPAVWLGGMSTHGVLLGGLAGLWLFCRTHRTPFWPVVDAVTVPAALLLALGRIGNFIDGQIVGRVTDVAWAVQFPDVAGFRHPVVLYDGLKNALLVPVLMYITARRPPAGTAIGIFLLLYAALRIPVDLFREYPTTLLGLATGQSLNIATAVGGLALVGWSALRRTDGPRRGALPSKEDCGHVGLVRPLLLVLLLLFSLTIPSDWTQDVPARYAKRHPGLVHSSLYPALDLRPLRAGICGCGRPAFAQAREADLSPGRHGAKS
jgi:phosphatidylglycerol:prolipoprotein diacylglycerol transferase